MARLLLALLASASVAVPGADADPTTAPARAIDGPSAGIVSIGGLAVARDGTGGVVYLRSVGGVNHVFVSRLLGGLFQPPEEIDGNLAAPSSQTVIAASSGGLLAVAFVNGGSVYASRWANAFTDTGPPQDLADGASNPALGMTTFGKAYLVFTAEAVGGHDVRAAFLSPAGTWSVAPGALNAGPADDAGMSAGRPTVAAANDGVGIAAWGESGHIYARRVLGTTLSTEVERVDPPSFSGSSEVSADEPSVSAGGDSSYADIAFHEVLSDGVRQSSRALMGRLHASQIDPVASLDGLSTPGSGGADLPKLALNEYGSGFITVHRTDVQQVIATHAGSNGTLDALSRADSQPNLGNPYATPGTAGLISNLIAWQQDPGPPGQAEIRARYSVDGDDLGPEQVISSPLQGPADAADGLAAGGDGRGDAAVVWLQGVAGARALMATQLYEPPGSIAPASGFAYLRNARPTVSWTPAAAFWGPIRYLVSVDGARISQTTATSLQVPAPLHDGPHSWQVTAVNAVGVSTTMRVSTFWTDTVAPTLSLTLTRAFQVGTHIHAYLRYSDAPAPESPAAASGIAAVVIIWGDGTPVEIGRSHFHAYRRAGRFRITVAVADRAGNVTRFQRVIFVKPKPKPKLKPKRTPASRRKSAGAGLGARHGRRR